MKAKIAVLTIICSPSIWADAQRDGAGGMNHSSAGTTGGSTDTSPGNAGNNSPGSGGMNKSNGNRTGAYNNENNNSSSGYNSGYKNGGTIIGLDRIRIVGLIHTPIIGPERIPMVPVTTCPTLIIE